jgi:formate hydrogenlyase subunit 6/NADH:ubiquinone oxidoreductase subunit I
MSKDPGLSASLTRVVRLETMAASRCHRNRELLTSQLTVLDAPTVVGAAAVTARAAPDSAHEMMKITSTRIISQTFFFGLFVFLCLVTQFSHLKGYPVSLFLEISPLVAIANAISTHALYRHLIWCLWLLIPTLLLGRFFCGWVCPWGSLHQFAGRYLVPHKRAWTIPANRYRTLFRTKYLILIFMGVLAIFGSLQIGWLDPLCLAYRSFASAVMPVADWLSGGQLEVAPRYCVGSWGIGLLALLLIAANMFIPRFFCRVLCPLGALLGLLSRWSWWRIDRNLKSCVDCGICRSRCEGACDPDTRLRKAECMVCFNCIYDCPHDALDWQAFPARETEISGPDLTRRQVVTSCATGLLVLPMLRSSGDSTVNFSPRAVRPPGAVAENLFLQRCLKCGQCMRVCPANTLQPAWTEAGIEGVWTPVLNMRMGPCELNCTLCGQVCPTGAIQAISIAQKLGTGAYSNQGPIRIGLAFLDRGRCLPWAMDTPCVVCQEVCPTSPKAISTRDAAAADGRILKQPQVNPLLCIGCGICVHECPVVDSPAVYVTAVGESRSRERTLGLQSRQIIPKADT